MPSSRSVPLYSLRPRNPPPIRKIVRGRLYGYGSNRPRSVGVKIIYFPTRRGTCPYIAVEEILGTSLFIHDCSVKFSGGTFTIYFTRHRYQPPNSALMSAHPGVPWHGQILVLRMSDTGHVDLRRGDLSLIEKVASRFIAELSRRSTLPRKLHLGPLV
ncbi:hypothetical protein VTO73DRAFT_15126 [Trametes versicolor]